MALKITEECIGCNACEPVCPNKAIYANGMEWYMADGTDVTESYLLKDGTVSPAFAPNDALSKDVYYIVPDKCTECQGFHDEPQCAVECPVDCCVPDEQYSETVNELLAKKDKLHFKK